MGGAATWQGIRNGLALVGAGYRHARIVGTGGACHEGAEKDSGGKNVVSG